MKLAYFLSHTATSLRRNALMTTAAISTVALSLLLLGGVQILGMIVNKAAATWEAKVEISVFLRKDATEGEIRSLQTQISEYPEVQDVTFVSSEQALAEFKRFYRDEPEFWQALSKDSLPASLRIKLTDAKFTEDVANRITGAPGIDDVRYGGEILRRLLQVNTLLRTVALTMSIILLFAAAALIANTIRLTIYARRHEIEIMKLVGATNWFVRVPFMLEGFFASLVGALVAGVIVLGLNWLLFSRVRRALPFMASLLNFSAGDMLGVLIVLFGVGALVGLMGSAVAVRRSLRV